MRETERHHMQKGQATTTVKEPEKGSVVINGELRKYVVVMSITCFSKIRFFKDYSFKQRK